MEGLYFFGEHLRWNLWFANPNVAGAFAAMLIAFLLPFTTFFPKDKRRRILFVLAFIAELVLWFVLAKTYSRGALVSATLCLIVCNVLFVGRGFPKRNLFTVLSIKTFAILAIIFATGFSARISPEYLKGDGSVSARTALWQGGLKMVSASPIAGWGVDKSGEEYINWYQPLDDNREYAGMVNSYLHIAVERGLPVLFAILSILALFTFSGIYLFFRKSSFALCDSLAIISCLISNSFSTLWIAKSLQWPLLFAVVMIFILFIKNKAKPILKLAGLSAMTGFGLCLIIYAAGFCINDSRIEKHSDFIRIRPRNTAYATKQISIFADDITLGKYCGKTIRATFDNFSQPVQLDIYCCITPKNNIPIDCDCYIFIGKSVSLLDCEKLNGKKIVIVNPLGTPDRISNAIKPCRIYLPSLDKFNQNPKWERYCKTHNIRSMKLGYSSPIITDNMFKEIIGNIIGSEIYN